MTIGGRIAELRKAQGLTQIKLAEMTGINASTLAAYERGRRAPKEETITCIAHALGVSVNALETNDLESVDTPHKTTKAQPEAANNLTTLTLTREEARLILFTRMNPDSMNFLQKFITSEQRERDQVEKAWKLIHEFQT